MVKFKKAHRIVYKIFKIPIHFLMFLFKICTHGMYSIVFSQKEKGIRITNN